MTGATSWPAHRVEVRPWRQQTRSGNRADRTLTSVSTMVPPYIAALNFIPGLELTVASERALLAVAQVDAEAEDHSRAVNRFLIRSESVASSKIEQISASAIDYAKATTGNRSNPCATNMVAATEAIHQLIARVGLHGCFTLDEILGAHRALMFNDPSESLYAGRLRDMQNWIGGSDHSPRDAIHVPPAPEHVPPLMTDLIEYLNREDVPIMVQAAIGHAQFESIHGFTDGNGRIGRALVSAVLHRRGATRNLVVPIASGLLAQRDAYFAALIAYREGDPEPIIRLFARSAEAAAVCSRATIERLNALPDRWHLQLKPRYGSATERLIAAFYDEPALTSEEAHFYAGTASSNTNHAITQLEAAGIIKEITGRKRDRVWIAIAIMEELDQLEQRIHAVMAGRGTDPS
ncbi:Fic family protein [Leucobacter sp. cx-42]|uniref:Fic family protein n=1 Tax=unclassified Leucobacter TaxID=2621730 RepID=UPI00165E343E|nr:MULTISPECIES: Fic family protein [unclassified Leucobacter]MBC9954437.1 Fic family protein [Leucobacter sp. cx-42]